MPFLSALAAHWRLTLALALTASLGAYIVTLRLERDHYRAKYEAEHAAFQAFVEKVRLQGEAAEREVAAKTAADKLAKEKSDAETSAALATLAGSIGRLRNERDRAIGRFVSAAAPCAASPQGADRSAEYERAYRALVAGLRAIGDESDRRIVKLNGAKEWARGEVP